MAFLNSGMSRGAPCASLNHLKGHGFELVSLVGFVGKGHPSDQLTEMSDMSQNRRAVFGRVLNIQAHQQNNMEAFPILRSTQIQIFCIGIYIERERVRESALVFDFCSRFAGRKAVTAAESSLLMMVFGDPQIGTTYTLSAAFR